MKASLLLGLFLIFYQSSISSKGSVMTEQIRVKGDNITLDLLLERRHGWRGRELVEAALALNPGLAALGVTIPLGTLVNIPELPPRKNEEVEVVDLFGGFQ